MLAVLVAVFCVWFDSPAHAAAKPASEQVYDFDIPRTSRVQAIHELSRQAGGLLLGYLSNDTAEEQALVGPVKGRQTVEDALRVILRSAMLTFRWVEKDILSVEPIKLKENSALEGELSGLQGDLETSRSALAALAEHDRETGTESTAELALMAARGEATYGSVMRVPRRAMY